jgi:hypothetical protein
LYDPKTGTFRPTGTTLTGFPSPAAVLLPTGRVLVVAQDGTSDALLYDPAAGTFSPTGSSSFARIGVSIALLKSGQVLVAGGQLLDASGVLKAAELYNPTTGKFTQTGSMKTGRDWFTATTLQDGRVLVVGGDDRSGNEKIFGSAEIYDPQTHTFTPTGSLASPRYGATATLLGNGKAGRIPPIRSAGNVAWRNEVAGRSIGTDHRPTVLGSVDEGYRF